MLLAVASLLTLNGLRITWGQRSLFTMFNLLHCVRISWYGHLHIACQAWDLCVKVLVSHDVNLISLWCLKKLNVKWTALKSNQWPKETCSTCNMCHSKINVPPRTYPHFQLGVWWKEAMLCSACNAADEACIHVKWHFKNWLIRWQCSVFVYLIAVGSGRHVTQVVKATLGHEVSTRPIADLCLKEHFPDNLVLLTKAQLSFCSTLGLFRTWLNHQQISLNSRCKM